MRVPHIVALILLGLAVLARGEEAESVAPNINAGNWNISGYLDLNMDEAQELAINANLAGEFFLIDNLSAGLSLGLDGETASQAVGTLGPSATFYFWNNDYLAPYIGTSFRVGLNQSDFRWIFAAEIGIEYFMLPSVALGPSVYVNHYQDDGPGMQRYGLLINLGIYI